MQRQFVILNAAGLTELDESHGAQIGRVQTTFDVGEALRGFNYTGCAVLLSLGVL
jgi:hypothetical protein